MQWKLKYEGKDELVIPEYLAETEVCHSWEAKDDAECGISEGESRKVQDSKCAKVSWRLYENTYKLISLH